ncbi:hypothetical protein HYPSUDRAFT_208803 [Hypholoma sublateritium FD-334 SS-4]|uniref:Uncharacterized protein n=1 Tax=Hypholoma sublateritium (strain FD-334 SS-4) TaxID=945553 RepID=A0A0D2NCJ9_HYPSF|nr:hypothetical protein HYPSUDRAFT_208803 [Hypholoma sublateritium FD-334 SS-4]
MLEQFSTLFFYLRMYYIQQHFCHHTAAESEAFNCNKLECIGDETTRMRMRLKIAGLVFEHQQRLREYLEVDETEALVLYKIVVSADLHYTDDDPALHWTVRLYNARDVQVATMHVYEDDDRDLTIEAKVSFTMISGDSHLSVDKKRLQMRNVRAGMEAGHQRFGLLNGISNAVVTGFDTVINPAIKPTTTLAESAATKAVIHARRLTAPRNAAGFLLLTTLVSLSNSCVDIAFNARQQIASHRAPARGGRLTSACATSPFCPNYQLKLHADQHTMNSQITGD